MTRSATDVDVTIAATEAGAAVVRAAYGGAITKHAKSATDFATEADLEAERVITAVITKARPDDPVEGEESGPHGSPAGAVHSKAAEAWLRRPTPLPTSG